MIVIYEKPVDFPGAYVARLWDAAVPAPTNAIIVRDSALDCADDAMAAGFTVCIGQSEYDDPHIVETWMK